MVGEEGLIVEGVAEGALVDGVTEGRAVDDGSDTIATNQFRLRS
jgi:hypothetical protein